MRSISQVYFVFVSVLTFAPHAGAQPTLDQARTLVERSGVPVWKRNIESTKMFRDKRATPFNVQAWASLDSEVNATTGAAPLARATSPRNSEEFSAFTDWLQWKVLVENADGRYSYAYAHSLMLMKDSRGGFEANAAIYFSHARLALLIDAARCKDRSGVDRIIGGFESQAAMKPIHDVLAKLAGRAKFGILAEAVSLEETRGERPALVWLCNSGISTIARALQEGRPARELPPQEGTLGRTIALDASGMVPEFVAQDDWRKARRDILDSYLRTGIEAWK